MGDGRFVRSFYPFVMTSEFESRHLATTTLLTHTIMTTKERIAKAKEWVSENYGESWWNECEKNIALRAYLAGTYYNEEA